MNDRPYTVRPIEQWPGKREENPVTSSFSAEWYRTEELLAFELEKLRARNVVLQLDVTESDLTRYGHVSVRARLPYQGAILSFESMYGKLQYACDRFDDWHDNVRAIALGLEALRKVERYGITKRGQQYTGWKALPARSMNRQEAEALIASYGGEAEALHKTHPDQGGKREEFDRVMEARKLLRGDR